MTENKNTYYITVGTGEISQSATASRWDYKITATNEEINELRSYFKQNYSTEWQSFVRAHIPFLEYHNDKENDEYDETMSKVYELLYKLGDDETRKHIEDMGFY
ncbi:hydrolase [Bacillus sp. Bva_UNVM-123]|uniref:hydrolase n=1 Tax=Bacillus sp. Bva_UNVM-123 TaxID=2829798 RepID=UPI00391F6235